MFCIKVANLYAGLLHNLSVPSLFLVQVGLGSAIGIIMISVLLFSIYLKKICVIIFILIIADVADVGGHTAEMLNLLSMLQKDRFTPRFYIAAATDNMSLQKAHLMEKSLVDTVDYIQLVSIAALTVHVKTFMWSCQPL